MKALFLMLALLSSFLVGAQEATKNKYTLAVDVSPYLFKGYSAKLGYLPSALPSFDVALEVFSMEIPELVVDLNAKNADKGWVERVNMGAALYVDKKLSKGKNSFWLGGGLLYLNQTASNTVERNEYTQLEYLVRLNYKWYPFKESGFYVNPYFALAFRHKLTGDSGAYALSPFLVLPSVYLSWEL